MQIIKVDLKAVALEALGSASAYSQSGCEVCEFGSVAEQPTRKCYSRSQTPVLPIASANR